MSGSQAVERLVESYGPHVRQIGEWFAPGASLPLATVVLVHGGFWRPRYDRHLQDPVALDLASRGYLCWNVDYRPSSAQWPATLSDIAAGYDHVVHGELSGRVDPQRIAVVGHSAGGQLAAWLASRHRLPADAPGQPTHAPRPALVVVQAGVVALTLAAEQGIGNGAPEAFAGGTPKARPERYRIADPVGLVPTGVRSLLVHTQVDDSVPTSQSEAYLDAAVAAGDDCRLALVEGDHFSHLDPGSDACARMRDALATLAGG
jgi:acetyl esterase/lipase